VQLGPDALLPELDKGIADDHIPVRLASASCVLQMLEGGGAIDEPQMEVAGDIVSKALNDAAAEVTDSGCQIATPPNQRMAGFLFSCFLNLSLPHTLGARVSHASYAILLLSVSALLTAKLVSCF
jgi:hypothetical protein